MVVSLGFSQHFVDTHLNSWVLKSTVNMRENVLWKITTQNSSFGLEPKACFSKVPVVTGSEKYLYVVVVIVLVYFRVHILYQDISNLRFREIKISEITAEYNGC